MSALSWTATAALATMAGVAVYNLLTAPRLEQAPPPRRLPRVSLLLPARDEEETLRETLPALLRLDYPRLEIVVLDDRSEDGTAEVVRRLAGGRVRLLRGAPTPPGWLGKSWACHQLAAAARGELLLFCDADVSPRPDAVTRTVGLMERFAADAATAIPRQRLRGWAERAVVPLVAQLPVLALLPMRLVARTRSPALSMANGQWLAFTRAAYLGCGGHRAVAGEVLEDVALGRRVKGAGLRLVPAVARRALSVRMYRGAAAVHAGFRKNLYALLGGRPLPFCAGVATFGLVAVYPWAAALAGSREALLPLGLLLGVRAAGASLFGHDVRTVALHPLGSLLAAAIAVHSWTGHLRGTLVWKGRALPTAGAAALPAGEGAPSGSPL